MIKRNKISITGDQNSSAIQAKVKEVSSYVELRVASILQLNRKTE